MSSQTFSVDLCSSLTHVWACLATDLRERAVHLVAQLAFNLVVAQCDWLKKEYTCDVPSRQTQDST